MSEVWTPEKLMAHRVVVGFDLDYSVARISLDHGAQTVVVGSQLDEDDETFCRRAYAEATRIAKERQRPRVRCVPGEDAKGGFTAVRHHYVIIDGRAMFETPKGDMKDMDLAIRLIAKHADDPSHTHLVQRMRRRYDREFAANAAIAAARKGGG